MKSEYVINNKSVCKTLIEREIRLETLFLKEAIQKELENPFALNKNN